MNLKLVQSIFFSLAFGSLINHASAEPIYKDLPLVPKYQKTHGILMGLAFVIFFPLGAFAIRGIRSTTGLWIHIACQLLGWVLMIAGFGIGIRTAKILDILYDERHTVIGTVVVVCMLIQPILGYIHHYRYVRTQQRSVWTTIHVWYGRVLILLGIINGGFGLQLVAIGDRLQDIMEGNGKVIAYGVLAGIFGSGLLVNAGIYEFGKVRVKPFKGEREAHELRQANQGVTA